jgi:hypothetical protein
LNGGGKLGIVVEEGEVSYELRGNDLQGPSPTLYPWNEKALCSMVEQTGFLVNQVGKRKRSNSGPAEILVLASKV